MELNQLMKEAREGDKNAESRLFQYLRESFVIFVQHRVWDRNAVEDIVQNAMLVIADKYRTTNFEVSFSAWAHKVLENKIIDYIRARGFLKNQPTELIDDNQSYMTWSFDPQVKLNLIACLRELSGKNNRYARILNLRYHGYTSREICGKLNITENALHIIISRARSLLDLCLKRRGR